VVEACRAEIVETGHPLVVGEEAEIPLCGDEGEFGVVGEGRPVEGPAVIDEIGRPEGVVGKIEDGTVMGGGVELGGWRDQGNVTPYKGRTLGAARPGEIHG
jgi:hypothetical protein